MSIKETKATDALREFLFIDLQPSSKITEKITIQNSNVKFERFKKSFWDTKKVLEITLSNPVVRNEIRYIDVKISTGYTAFYNLDEMIEISNEQCRYWSMEGFNLNQKGASSEDRENGASALRMGETCKRILNIHKEALKLF